MAAGSSLIPRGAPNDFARTLPLTAGTLAHPTALSGTVLGCHRDVVDGLEPRAASYESPHLTRGLEWCAWQESNLRPSD